MEWLSQYNQGRQATLHPPTLRAMLNIAGIYLKQTEGALGFQKGNYELLSVCKTEKQTYKALDFVERNVSDGEEVLAMLIYVRLEKKEVLYNLEFAQNFIHAANERRLEKWKTCIKSGFSLL